MRDSGQNAEVSMDIVSLRRMADLVSRLRPADQTAGEPARLGESAQSEERVLSIEGLLDAIPESVSVLDLESRILTVNREFISRYGLNNEEVVGKTIAELGLLSADQRKAISEHVIPRLLREGVVQNIEVLGMTRNGSAVSELVSFALLKNASGQPVGILCSGRDVTRLKEVENALRDSEERYRTLVESAGEAIASVNDDGVFTFMNTTGARRLGGRPCDFIGKTMWDLFPPGVADDQVASIRDVIRSGKGKSMVSLSQIQGQVRWYNTTLEPLRDSHGKVWGALVIARDIHEFQQTQDQLSTYREKMIRAERLACLGVLSATLVHEMTQPLTVVRLSIQNAMNDLRKEGCSQSVLKDLQEARNETIALAETVTRFRTFAQRSSDRTPAKVALADVANRIVRLLQESARQSGISLETRGLAALPLVYGHEKDLEQLFFALTQNAIQAAAKGKENHFCISGIQLGDYVELRFEDDCRGIALEDLNHIFEPFFTTKRPGEGTGLGLCIVQRVVDEAHGQLRVKSRKGRGTTFFVTLPIDGN
jgi:PAS domain S-box-containing protein